MATVRVLFAFALLIIAAVGAAPVTGDHTGDYHIELDESHTLDIPERTIDTDDYGEYTVSSIGQYTEDETVTVETEAPANESYAIRLIDSQERFRESEFAEGDGQGEFDLDRYAPGTYAIVMMNGSEEVYALEPIVISGYTVTHQTADEVEADESLSVELTLEQIDSGVDEPPHNVALAFGNESTTIRTDATRTEDLDYTAEIDIDSLSPGTYELYVGVESDNTVYGEEELIGADTYDIEVVEASEETQTGTATSTATETAEGGGSAGGGIDASASTESGTTEESNLTTEAGTTATTVPTPDTATSSTTDSDSDSESDSPSSSDDATGEPETDQPTDTTTSGAENSETMGQTPTTTPVLPSGAAILLLITIVLAAQRVY